MIFQTDNQKVYPVKSKLLQTTVSFNGGFSTLEILIAVVIAIFALSGVLLVSFGNQSLALDSQTSSEAQHKAQELLEQEQAEARLDFNLVNPLPPPPATFIQDGIYQKKVDVVQVDSYTKKVTANITWTGDHNRTESSELSTLVTNPSATNGGDTCNSVLLSDWKNPQLTAYEFGKDIFGDPSSGFPIGDIDINDHKLYVVVNNSHGNNDPNFFVLDVSTPSVKPAVLNSMDNNPSTKSGLNAVHVAGHYAYVANAYGSNFSTCTVGLACSQLQIIDLNTMTVVARYKVPGVTGSGGQAIGKSIYYKDGIVYLGLAKAGGSAGEFIVIDVGGGGIPGASPTNPRLLGNLEIDNAVNAIFVKGDYAYIASPNDEELKVVDISIPSNPQRVGGFDAPGGGGNNGNGKSLALVGDILYFGRTLLYGNELYILDDSNPETNLPVLGSKDIKGPGNSNTSVNGILIRDYLMFLLTNDDFQIWKVDVPANITQWASPLPTPGGNGTTIDCEGNYIFFASIPANDKGYIAVVTSGP